MSVYVIAFVVLMSVLIIYGAYETDKKDTFELRKQQSINMTQENAIRQRFQEYTERKVDYSKRYEIETLCMNAGFPKMTYGDYKLISYASAFIIFVIFGILMMNIFLGLVMAVVGLNIPKQVLGFIRNKRTNELNKQIGPFMHMVIKRYQNTTDFEKSLVLTMQEFKGTEPMYSELKLAVSEIKVGVDIGVAMDNLARRTGNSFLARLSDYYKIAYKLGTEEVREKLLLQAYLQFEENRKMKDFLKKEISEPVRDAYMMLATIPAFAGFGILTMDGYVDFWLTNIIGKVALAILALIMIGSVWFINTKIAAPLD